MNATTARNGFHKHAEAADLTDVLAELRQLRQELAWLTRLPGVLAGSPTAAAPSAPGLTKLEARVLAHCSATPQTAKVLARTCQRSINRVREAIASLVARELLQRTANWCVRLPQKGGAA